MKRAGDDVAHPKKLRDYQTITVDGVPLLWRVIPGEPDSRIVVRGTTSGCVALQIELPGWRDAWLAAPAPVTNHPRRFDRAFVARAVRFGRAVGWDPARRGTDIHIVWADDAFDRAGR